jgi:hypothetical protein
MGDINATYVIRAAIQAGPFAVLVAVLSIVAFRWQDVPPDVLAAAVQHLPWIVVVMTLLWLVVWLVNTHKQERSDLVDSLSRMHQVIEGNTRALGSLSRYIEHDTESHHRIER